MKIYLNEEFECFTAQNEQTTREIETDFFEGKCKTFIEGYRFVPEGESWTRSDGVQFTGQMISPFKDYTFLEMAQSLFEEINTKAEQTQSINNENFSAIGAAIETIVEEAGLKAEGLQTLKLGEAYEQQRTKDI